MKVLNIATPLKESWLLPSLKTRKASLSPDKGSSQQHYAYLTSIRKQAAKAGYQTKTKKGSYETPA